MGKRRSGPEGPDHAPEPFEIETPGAAQVHHKSECDCAQDCLNALFAQYGEALSEIHPDRVVYDSGWEETGRIAVRVVLGAGGENPELWRWVRKQILQPGIPEESGS